MNSLIPVTNDIHLEKLRSPNGSITVEYRIAHAKYKGTRIGSMEFDLCISKLYDLCEKAFLDLGFFKVADNQKVLEHLPKAIVELIKRRKDFQYLTIELLSIILEYGCHERLQCEGEIHTINIVYIERWVERTWLHPDFRRPIDLYIESSRQLPEVKKLTPEQEEYDICINCLEAFEQYKKTNQLPLFSKPLWNYIRKIQNIQWDERSRKYIEREAKRRSKKVTVRKSNLTNIGEELTNNRVSTVFSISLEFYFDLLIEKKEPLVLPYKLRT